LFCSMLPDAAPHVTGAEFSKILPIHCLSLDRARPRDKQWIQRSQRRR
jgi:hypothetical protein